MERVWLVEFQNGDNEYIAYGHNRDSMPVFEVGVDYCFQNRMKFPHCLKFMPYAEVGPIERIETYELEELLLACGATSSKRRGCP